MIKELLKRKCAQCETEFTKPVNCSKRSWQENYKFCSRSCGLKSHPSWNKGVPMTWHPWKKGKTPWNKGKKSPYPAWNKDNGDYAKALGFGKWMKGKKLSLETRKILSDKNKKRVAEGKHNFYIDGRTPLNVSIRHSVDYKIWRDVVFNRDDYTCQECGDRSGQGHAVYLHAHHLKPFATFPELRFIVSNGLTLCDECHYDRHKK